MGQQAPSPGQVSPDGQFVWDGTQWNSITAFRWEPTETTRRMQLLAGGCLVVSGLVSVIVTFFEAPYLRQATAQALTQQQQNQGMTADQIKAIVDFSVTLGIAFAVAIGVVYAVFGIMTLLRRWGWLFYADLVILGLAGLGVVTSLYGVARGGAGPAGFVILNLLLSAAALAIFIWMLVTRVRGSVWAARKVPNF